MADFKFYLTSLEPNLSQSIYSQSIGGYCSNSLLYRETTLSSNVGLYDTSFTLNTPQAESWIGWENVFYININNEIIELSALESGTATAIQRGSNGIINFHLAGDVVRASNAAELFNNVVNNEYKQYRCLAVKNTPIDDPSDSEIANDVQVYLKQNSRNDESNIRIAIERPSSKYLTSISTNRTILTLTDTSLSGVYLDDYFNGTYLMVSGENGVGFISDFDGSSGTFTFSSSFSTVTTNKVYEVFPASAQRLKTGTDAPVNSDYITDFSYTNSVNRLSLSDTTNVSNSSDADVLTNDLFYIWVERTLQKGSASFDNNDFVIVLIYDTSG